MARVPLTLERRRGSEVVFRDAEGQRWVVPGAALPKGGDRFEVELVVQEGAEKNYRSSDFHAAARSFLTQALTQK